MSVNQLILGDNLEILKGIEDETIDLIYLDPPFFSNKTIEEKWTWELKHRGNGDIVALVNAQRKTK